MTDFNPAYFRAQGWWRDETLCDWIDRCAVSAPDRAAILTADRTLTFTSQDGLVRIADLPKVSG